MQGFRQRDPKVPIVLRAPQIGAWVALDRVIKVWKFEWIAQKKHRRVVADQIPVAFLGVELDGKAANITLGIGGAALAGHGGEAGKQLGFLAHLRKDLRAGVFRDVVRDCKRPVGAGALGVHAPLEDHFAVKMRQLLQKPHVPQQLRATWPGGHHVLIVNDRTPGIRGQLLFLAHAGSFLLRCESFPMRIVRRCPYRLTCVAISSGA